MKNRWLSRVIWMLPILPMMGCDEEPDERVAEIAIQSAERQAAQNQLMAELQQHVAQGSRQLVEADSQARQELAELQRELRADQAELGRKFDALESERQEIASERYWDSMLSTALYAAAGILACLLPLLLCAWMIYAVRDDQGTDQMLAELLVEELTTDRPLLLPPRQAVPLLGHQPPMSSGALPGDDSTDTIGPA